MAKIGTLSQLFNSRSSMLSTNQGQVYSSSINGDEKSISNHIEAISACEWRQHSKRAKNSRYQDEQWDVVASNTFAASVGKIGLGARALN